MDLSFAHIGVSHGMLCSDFNVKPAPTISGVRSSRRTHDSGHPRPSGVESVDGRLANRLDMQHVVGHLMRPDNRNRSGLAAFRAGISDEEIYFSMARCNKLLVIFWMRSSGPCGRL